MPARKMGTRWRQRSLQKASVERAGSPPTLRCVLLAFEYPKVMFISFCSHGVW